MTIRLISTDTGSTVLTERPPIGQASKGDFIVVSAKLRNAGAQFGRPKSAVVGNASYVFTFRSQTVADVIVESTLPGGRLRTAGPARLNTGKHTFTVTGGREDSRAPVAPLSSGPSHATASGNSCCISCVFLSHSRSP